MNLNLEDPKDRASYLKCLNAVQVGDTLACWFREEWISVIQHEYRPIPFDRIGGTEGKFILPFTVIGKDLPCRDYKSDTMIEYPVIGAMYSRYGLRGIRWISGDPRPYQLVALPENVVVSKVIRKPLISGRNERIQTS